MNARTNSVHRTISTGSVTLGMAISILCFSQINSLGSAALPSVQTEYRKLVPSVPGEGIKYGVATSIEGDLAGVANWDHLDVPTAAYLYDSKTGKELSRITITETSSTQRFTSIDISNGRLLLGSELEAVNNKSGAGAVRLFDVSDPKSPIELTEFTSPDVSKFSGFGSAIDFQGDRALIGAYGGSGAAFLYDLSDPSNIHSLELRPQSQTTNQLFGASVSMSNNVGIVGTFSNNAYLFDLDTGSELSRISPISSEYSHFGQYVDLSGDRAVIWSRQNNGGPADNGAALVYDISDPTNPVHLITLTGSMPLLEKGYGGRVAIEGDHVLLAARSANISGTFSSDGAAYLFDISNLSNVREIRLMPSDGSQFAEFGLSVDMDRQNILVGAWSQEVNGIRTGAAYMFAVPEPFTSSLILFCTIPWLSLIRIHKTTEINSRALPPNM